MPDPDPGGEWYASISATPYCAATLITSSDRGAARSCGLRANGGRRAAKLSWGRSRGVPRRYDDPSGSSSRSRIARYGDGPSTFSHRDAPNRRGAAMATDPSSIQGEGVPPAKPGPHRHRSQAEADIHHGVKIFSYPKI